MGFDTMGGRELRLSGWSQARRVAGLRLRKWGRGGFTTQDIHRSQITTRAVALVLVKLRRSRRLGNRCF
jgi:hypothetical protein